MKPKPWSHSALSAFNTCPRQYHEIKVLKNFVEPQGEALVWGNRVHEAFEHYLKDGTPLPVDLKPYQAYADAIKSIPGDMYVEHEMALDSSLTPCDKWAKNVFVRGIVDVLHTRNGKAYAIDHKTGKRKPDSKQMKLMALLTFAHFPTIDTVKVGFFWLKTGEKDTEQFTRADIPALWQEFLPEVKQFAEAFRTDVWQPRQSGLCKHWCAVTSCEFNQPRRKAS